jgi:D-amino peptidase
VFFQTTRKTFEAVFFVGCHAMAGTLNGFLDHTQNSRQWFEYRLNGRPTGEIGMIAAAAGAFNLPLTLVTGDEAACQEARAFVGNLETAAVKQGVGRNRARLYDADDARRRIREAACRALRLSEAVRPFKPLAPIDVQLTLYRSDMCDALAERLGYEVERLDARTVRKIAADGSQIYF